MERDYSNITPGFRGNGADCGSRFRIRDITNPPKASKEHKGRDIQVPIGTPVQAQATGKVVWVDPDATTTRGNFVVVEYELVGGGKAFTLDLHLDSISVEKNDPVVAGQELGKSGSTGRSGGPHLHHEERLGVPNKKGKFDWNNSKPLDPDKDPFGFTKGAPTLPSNVDDASARPVCPPRAIKKVKDKFNQGERTRSPIVLDLDGDGVETVGKASGTQFDHGADGFAETTGWAGFDDGLLVRDLDGNGRIDSGRELFGSETLLANGKKAAHGFEALKELDGNQDGRIDSADAAYSRLRVWRDFNADGVSNEDELYTLPEAGVGSIAVGFAESGYVDAKGNAHKQVGSYTTTDGQTRTATDVWVDTDPTYSVATQWVEVPEDIAALPDVQGYGTVRDLRQAMAMDTSGALKALVLAFTQATTREERASLVTQVLYQWCGVQDVDPGSRAARMIYGNAIGDARKLATLEAFVGTPYVGTWCWGELDPNPHGPAAKILLEAFEELSTHVYSMLMIQSHYKALLENVEAVWNSEARGVDWDVSSVEIALRADYQVDPVAAAVKMNDVGPFVSVRPYVF